MWEHIDAMEYRGKMHCIAWLSMVSAGLEPLLIRFGFGAALTPFHAELVIIKEQHTNEQSHVINYLNTHISAHKSTFKSGHICILLM